MSINTGQIFSIDNEATFENVALEIFKFQAEHCLVYKDYIFHLNINPSSISAVKQIPFLPISFFKTHEVLSTITEPEIVFSSTGTTGLTTSKH